MCAPKAPKPPQASQTRIPPPPSAEIIDADVETERQREMQRARGRRGRASTMLASAAGNYLPPTAQQKTALGA